MGESAARSYPSDHKDTGTVARGVALKTARAGSQISTLASVIIDVATEGAPDTKRLLRVANEISRLGVYISDTQWNVADANYSEAKRAAAKLGDKP